MFVSGAFGGWWGGPAQLHAQATFSTKMHDESAAAVARVERRSSFGALVVMFWGLELGFSFKLESTRFVERACLSRRAV